MCQNSRDFRTQLCSILKPGLKHRRQRVQGNKFSTKMPQVGKLQRLLFPGTLCPCVLGSPSSNTANDQQEPLSLWEGRISCLPLSVQHRVKVFCFSLQPFLPIMELLFCREGACLLDGGPKHTGHMPLLFLFHILLQSTEHAGFSFHTQQC